MAQYIVRASNSFGSITMEWDSLHDAEICVNTIKRTNEALLEEGSDDMIYDYSVTEIKSSEDVKNS